MAEYWQRFTETLAAYTPNLLGALAILVVGWLVALIIASVVRGVLRKTGLERKFAGAFRSEKEKTPDVAHGVSRIVFWIIMGFVIISFLQTLGLTMTVGPLNGMLEQVLAFLPLILGALALLLVAWLVATVLRAVITGLLGATRVDERLSSDGGEVKLTYSLGEAAYWLVFLLFLPAILGVLRMEGLLAPVQSMLDKLLGFLPNLLAAGIIGLVGWFVAGLLRRIVSNLLAATGLDKLGTRAGLQSLSGLAGLIVYILVLIPVLIAALNALALEAITTPASAMLGMILATIPKVFAAAVVISIAIFVGRLVSRLVTDLLTGIGFNGLPEKLGLGAARSENGPAQAVGTLVMVVIMALAIFEASSLLGFAALSAIVTELTVFGGHVLMGVLILAVGLWLANLAASAIRAGGSGKAGPMALVARVAILMLSGAIAIRHMGLANEIVNLAFGLVLGSLAVAAAIAFGIGGRKVAAHKLAEWTGTSSDE